MSNMHKALLFISLIVGLLSCKTTKDATYSGGVDERMLDTLTVSASQDDVYSLPVYNGAADRVVDLLHTQLKVEFDWTNQAVMGEAALILTPIFYDQDTVVLDAVGFDIDKITGSNVSKLLSYDYDGKKLKVALDKTYKKGEKIIFVVYYTAYPERNEIGGSSAITSDKGLFFIDPLDKDPNKPSQIWTQGETENNSRWFPTIDKPNERCTQDIRIVVDTQYVTLSNGVKIYSKDNNDGTRTDRWILDKPHAPYLFMLAVGEYAQVTDTISASVPLNYYVEPDYEPYAEQIFNHTPEMLDFFSNLLDYPYPWPKYSQIVARDYVSGAMENTTAVIFGEFVQKTDRELIDNDNDLIVAHEMFHHWFGDLVTCENWANLTLNEGFANYSEYLWYEHKYGKDRAEAHRFNERSGYLGSAAQQGVHPLIHYSYEDKEDMFDAHSYNKGGLVLHMLRDLVGDKAFFASLNKYLVDNEYTAVEVDELRMAFEDVTGLDLQWFFNQWYLTEGHPKLEVSYGQNLEAGIYTVVVEQTQNPDILPIFRLPLDIALVDQSGKKHIYQVDMTRREQLFLLNVDFPVAYALVDNGNTVLAEINEDKTMEEYIAQAQFEENYIDRMAALKKIENTADIRALLPELRDAGYWQYRRLAAKHLDTNSPEERDLLVRMATTDSHSAVRSMALKNLSDNDYSNLVALTQSIIKEEQAYPVLGNALKALYKIDKAAGLKATEALDESESKNLLGTVAEIYAATGDAKYLPFFEQHLADVPFYEMYNYYDKYADLLKMQSPEAILKGAEALAVVSNGSGNIYRKYGTTKAISTVRKAIMDRAEEAEEGPKKNAMLSAQENLTKLINDIIDQESNENLLSRYASFKTE